MSRIRAVRRHATETVAILQVPRLTLGCVERILTVEATLVVRIAEKKGRDQPSSQPSVYSADPMESADPINCPNPMSFFNGWRGGIGGVAV